MEKWFSEVILETNNIKLLPIKMTHKADLINASDDGNLSDLWFTSVPTLSNIDSYLTTVSSLARSLIKSLLIADPENRPSA
jgi:hypothetical protein